jgi:hypothetical protein
VARGLIVLMVVVGTFAGLAGCGSGNTLTNKPGTSNTITPSGANVQKLTVGAGPANNYVNGLFTSVTVCYPGSATSCQTIDGVLVDTGSSGLRLLSSAVNGELTLNLPQYNNAASNPVLECSQYVDLSYTWGTVRLADVRMAGESASSVPVNVLGDPGFPTVPSSCANTGGTDEDSLQGLGANGILGVSSFLQDCGDACASGSGSPPPAAYYECPTPTTCQPAFVSLDHQVANPVAFFSADNNGVIIELPSVPSASVSASGSIVFGIGTTSNNALGSAVIFPVNAFGDFLKPVVFNSRTYADGFIDSGSNGIFFSGVAGLAVCSLNPGFYCPSSTRVFSATNQGANNEMSTVQFSVGNADQLFSNVNDWVFGTLAGPNPDPQGFDWGLPFFFGRNVYVSIEGMSTPSGPGPYWAY